ncbi:uncharacterized protein LOC142571180 [Dermacentor variabilis]|uniref:uncharacterized protein LOC142571180 n=1 Tax=Dermacentor variabilis TaxID=34621 RepID=UPI003F5AF4F0
MADAGAAESGFLAIPCSSFYNVKKHEKTQKSIERLLELIADGNISDVGESDEEDATCEATDACVAAAFTNLAEEEGVAAGQTQAEEVDTEGACSLCGHVYLHF